MRRTTRREALLLGVLLLLGGASAFWWIRLAPVHAGIEAAAFRCSQATAAAAAFRMPPGPEADLQQLEERLAAAEAACQEAAGRLASLEAKDGPALHGHLNGHGAPCGRAGLLAGLARLAEGSGVRVLEHVTLEGGNPPTAGGRPLQEASTGLPPALGETGGCRLPARRLTLESTFPALVAFTTGLRRLPRPVLVLQFAVEAQRHAGNRRSAALLETTLIWAAP